MKSMIYIEPKVAMEMEVSQKRASMSTRANQRKKMSKSSTRLPMRLFLRMRSIRMFKTL